MTTYNLHSVQKGKISHKSIVCSKLACKCIFLHISFGDNAEFDHGGLCYFNDCRRTKHHPMMKQTVPESLDYHENVDVTTNSIVG